MTDEYLTQRRRYIEEVRNSFSAQNNSMSARNARLRAGVETEREIKEATVGRFAIWKVRVLLSVLLFAAFVLCDRTNTRFFSFTTEAVEAELQKNTLLPFGREIIEQLQTYLVKQE